MEKLVTVDVIIPTYKPDKKFYQLMEMLKVQTYPINQIIIMNTEEAYFHEDSLAELKHVEVHHISKEEFDHGATRTAGVSCGCGDIIVFMTQDALPKDEFLIENLIQPIVRDMERENLVAISYARQLPDKDCKVLEEYTRSFNYPPKDRIKMKKDLSILGIKTFFCSNVCAAYRRDIFHKLGGFINGAIFNEDMIFAGHAIQAGYSVAYRGKAEVIHSHNYTKLQQFHRNFDLAVSQKDNPEVFQGIKSESEGMRLVKKTVGYLLDHGKWYLIPELILTSGFKYAGYFLGKRYDRLPEGIVVKCSMNKGYWRKRTNV